MPRRNDPEPNPANAGGGSPYSRAMLECWQGDAKAAYTILRDDGFRAEVPVAAAFAGPPFSPLEQLALERCGGSILDVGAGAGRHALFLQQQGHDVTALELEPELVDLLSARGVIKTRTGSVFSLAGGPFDTLLMLMNGFGMVGTVGGAAAFFENARKLLAKDGQILCDSLDVRKTLNPLHLAYQERNLRDGRPCGQMRFCIEHQGWRGEAFDWLHLDFDSLRDLARGHGWSAEVLAREDDGRYLARLTDDGTRMP